MFKKIYVKITHEDSYVIAKETIREKSINVGIKFINICVFTVWPV